MYKKQKIFIHGMARSGYEVAKILLKRGNDVTITDQKEQDKHHLEEIEDLGAKFLLSTTPEEHLDESFDLVVKNPGIHYDHPVEKRAEELGIKVINEMELIFNILPKDVFVIGITGSNGKTTTTTLTYELLRKSDKKVHIGGNIGIPFAAMYEDISSGDVLVLEISAQQLHDFYNFHPNIAIVTNIIETHIDFFKTFENYRDHKYKLLQNQTRSDIAILNGEDELLKNHPTKAKKITFSIGENTDIHMKDNYIMYKDEQIINTKDIKIKGNHNLHNIMCAVICAKEFGVTNNDIKDVLSSFGGVEHRTEFVAKINKREFYNDSKSTNTIATKVALAAFKKNVILLLGGLDRGHPFDDLENSLKVVDHIIAYGETKHRICDFAKKVNKDCVTVETLEDAVRVSYNLSNEGDIILLSPSCASWDQFKDYEERGRAFKKYVEIIKEKNNEN